MTQFSSMNLFDRAMVATADGVITLALIFRDVRQGLSDLTMSRDITPALVQSLLNEEKIPELSYTTLLRNALDQGVVSEAEVLEVRRLRTDDMGLDTPYRRVLGLILSKLDEPARAPQIP